MEGTKYSRLISEEIKPKIGSRVLNAKAQLIGGELSGDIMELLEQRGVLVFPEINFNDAEQIAFTSTLGKFAREIFGEEIYKITLDAAQNSTAEYLKATFFWHFDGYMSPMPIRASLLSAKRLSPAGGDTEFCNTYSAYDALPAELKQQVESLRAVHAMASTQLDFTPEPTYEKWLEWRNIGRKELPLVWKHASGRKSLVLGNSAHAILGLEPLDSTGLLIRLRDFATQPDFVYTHKWKVGDLVMWDNTGTLHRATPYPLDCDRMLHRTKLEGDESIA
jgi:alpha-ketoglutarate-dependent taurine dioxygenase